MWLFFLAEEFQPKLVKSIYKCTSDNGRRPSVMLHYGYVHVYLVPECSVYRYEGGRIRCSTIWIQVHVFNMNIASEVNDTIQKLNVLCSKHLLATFIQRNYGVVTLRAVFKSFVSHINNLFRYFSILIDNVA